MSTDDTTGTSNGNGHAPFAAERTSAPLAGPAPPSPAPPAPAPTEAAPAPLDPCAAASVTAAPVQVAPGEVAHATLSVTNLRSEPTTFALSLSGLEPGWYGLPERVGPLAPGARAEVAFRISLPKGYPPCSLLVAIEARPLPDAGARGSAGARASAGARGDDERRAAGRHDLQVLVGDGASVAARLDPVDVVGGARGRFSVVLRNRSSQSQQVRLEGVSPDPGLALRFDPENPLLLPGRQVHVAGSVHVRRALKGGAKRRPFAVRVQGRGTPVMAEGSFTSHPWLPSWAAKTLVVGLVVALWAAVAVVGIRALSSHLHHAAVQRAQVAPPSTASKGKAPKTAKASKGPSSAGSSPGTSTTTPSAKAGRSPSLASRASSSQTVVVTGKVTGNAPGGVTVTLAPTSLVSPQALGATGAGSGTLAAARRGTPRTPRTARGGVAIAPRAVLTSAVRHRRAGDRRTGGDPRTAVPAAPMLVSASHRMAPIPDGKVYGTEAAAAFFPGLVASLTPTLTTKTAPDGTFVFTGVPAPGTYLVSFTEPGYNTRSYIVQTQLGANVTLDTVLTPGTGSLSGMVTGPSGPLGGVSITVSDGAITITTVTPTTGPGVGTWSVSGLNTPDDYLVSASAPGYGTQTTTASLGPSASLAGVDLVMKPGVGSISGTVTDASSGQPVGDVTVTATDGTQRATATTSTVAPVGTYTLANLAIPGTWTLTISGQGWITQTERVALDGSTTVNFSLTKSGANVVGIVSSGGKGLANVGLTLSNQTDTFKTLSESVAPVGGFDFGQVPPGHYVLSATDFGYATQSASVSVGAGETQTVDLTLPFVGQSIVKSGTVTGSVVNQFTGAPLATVPIDLDGKPSGAVTNGNGVYSVAGVTPGLHEITALGASKGFADAGVQVSVAEGATVTAPIIALPSLATLTGIVLSAATGEPVANPTVKLLQGGAALGTPVTYTSTSSGTYKITDIPAGSYVLEVTATGYDPSETSVSVGPGETLTQNVSLTEGPSYQAKTYLQTSSGTLQPEGGVCVLLSRTTAGTPKTTVAKLTTSQGGPVAFTALVAADTYEARFELPTTSFTTPKTCTTLTSGTIRASAPPDVFVARPDNTAIYPAVLAPAHGTLSVVLQFPYVIAGSGGNGITKDCPVEASTSTESTTLPTAPCPQVTTSTASLPKVSITGTTGYATQANGTPGSPETATVNLVAPTFGSDVWTYPTGSTVPTFVSTQVTLLVYDAAGQFQTLSKSITLPTSGSTTLPEIVTAVPVPVAATISPDSGVSVAVNPDVLSPTHATGTANDLTSTDHIGAVEGTAGGLKWSDPATGASGGAAQPGTYTITLSAKGYVTLSRQVVVPLCARKSTGACTSASLGTISLSQLVTLTVEPTNVPGAPLTLPTVALLLVTGTSTTTVATKQLVATGTTYRATFTDDLTPTKSYEFTVAGPGIQTYTSTALPKGATNGVLTEKPALTEDGWATGTVEGVLVPTNSSSAGATEALAGATVEATSGTCATAGHPVTFTTTTATTGAFLLVGTTGGLTPTHSYELCTTKAGFTAATTSLTAKVGKNTVGTIGLTASKITQQLDIAGVATGVVVTVTATSPIGPSLRCTFTVGSTTPHTCTTASAKTTSTATGTPKPTLFSFQLDPTTYSFTISAPSYESVTIGPIPYAPGEQPSEKSYTLTQQLVTVKGTVTVSATGRKSGAVPIATLPLTLTSSSGTKQTTHTTSTGTYAFTPEPVGDYTITVGDTYTTLSPISFSTGTTSTFVENFTVYAPAIPLTVDVTSKVTAASANGVTVTLTPPTSASPVTKACGTHTLLEEGLGTKETATAVGTALHASASFSSLVPDVYTVSFSGVGTTTDAPTLPTYTLVVCPSSASAPATTPSPATFTLDLGEISATVTLTTASSSPPQVTMSAGTELTTTCTPPAPASGSTTTSCTMHLVTNLTTYTVAFSATGYATHQTSVTLSSTTAKKTLTVTLARIITHVTVTMTATANDPAVKASLATATVKLTSSAHTYTATTSSTGVATFTTVVAGTYTVLFTPTKLTGASSTEHEGTVTVSSTRSTFTVPVKTGKVTGTITLTPKPSSTVTVTVAVGTVTCTTVAVGTSGTATYSCVLPPGTYTLTFSATGYTRKTVSGVTITVSSTPTTQSVTLS